MTKDLYTNDDIRKVRDTLLDEQDGKCACLGIQIKPERTPVLDHAHDDQQLVRAVLEREVNAFIGVMENGYKRYFSYWLDKPLPEILRAVADYLEVPVGNRYRHPGWIKKVQSMFNKLNAQQQGTLLKSYGYPYGKNLIDRKMSFKKISMDREIGYEKLLESFAQVQKVWYDNNGVQYTA